jgi:hypothetical protein
MIYENLPEIYLDTGVPRELQGNVMWTFLFSFIPILSFSSALKDISSRHRVFCKTEHLQRTLFGN